MVNVSVTKGQVHVNSGWLAHQSEGSWVYEFDLRAKYAQLQWLSGDSVAVGRGPGTTSYEPSDRPTVVRFEGLPAAARLHAVVERYSLFVHIFVPGTSTMVWSDDQS